MSRGPLKHLQLGLCHMLLLFCACFFHFVGNFGKLDQKDSLNNGTLAFLSVEALATV